MKPYKNLFIDLDDTLLDTAQNNWECLEEMYADYHWDRYYASFEAFYSIYMPHNLDLWAQYRNGEIDRNTLIVERFRYVLSPLGIEDKRDVLAVNRNFLRRTTYKKRTLPGAHELMEYLHGHYRTFILSNGFREVQSRKLASAGLAPYFDGIILSEDAASNKPNRRIFHHALTTTNSRRVESLMIGDSWDADIVGAHNANIDQIWFNPSGLEPKDFTPTYTVASLDEIRDIL